MPNLKFPVMSETAKIEKIALLGYKVYNDDPEKIPLIGEGIISTINPHSYIIARKDCLFREALLESDFLLPDGIGIQLASKIILRKTIKKIAGSDMHSLLLTYLNENRKRCFYLGSSDRTLELIKSRLALEASNVKAGFCSPPFKEVFTDEECERMISEINHFRPDVLFVGMTAPKQEKWVSRNRGRLDVPMICSIGAVFDFYAGTVKRPGKLWINLGLEWFVRFIKEPRRLWRRNLISNPLFLWYVFVEKMKQTFTFRRDIK